MILVDKVLYYWTSQKPDKKFKVWEVQLSWDFNRNFDISIQFSLWCVIVNIFSLFMFRLYKYSECDHEGTYFVINILGLELAINHHDVRHWDYENDCHEDGENPEDWNRWL